MEDIHVIIIQTFFLSFVIAFILGDFFLEKTEDKKEQTEILAEDADILLSENYTQFILFFIVVLLIFYYVFIWLKSRRKLKVAPPPSSFNIKKNIKTRPTNKNVLKFVSRRKRK